MPRSRRYSRRRRSRRLSRRYKRPRTAGRRRRAPLRSGGFYSTRGKNELKFFDLEQAGVLTPANAATPFRVDDTPTQYNQTLIFCPQLGSDASQRIGRQVNIRKIVLKGIMASQPESYNGMVRIMLVYDAQTNASAFTLGTLLKGNGGQVFIDSLQNLDNRDRFKIIVDKQFMLQKHVLGDNNATPVVLATSGASHKFLKMHKKLRLPVVFNNNSTGGIGDITTGSLYCIVMHTLQSNATNAIGYNFQWRVRYYDS